jgi:hypothetical protein
LGRNLSLGSSLKTFFLFSEYNNLIGMFRTSRD